MSSVCGGSRFARQGDGQGFAEKFQFLISIMDFITICCSILLLVAILIALLLLAVLEEDNSPLWPMQLLSSSSKGFLPLLLVVFGDALLVLLRLAKGATICISASILSSLGWLRLCLLCATLASGRRASGARPGDSDSNSNLGQQV